uniref:Uncharacterized protein n=1 Tax=Timspurckia oligopyrenoides TaxID=708627 RepID=A0A7S0ZAG8_9RHOD
MDIISLPLTCEMLEKSLSEESSSFPGGSEIQKVVGSFRNRGLDVIGWYSAGGSRSDADLQPKSKSNAKRINLQTHDSVWKRFSSRGFHRSVEEHGDALDSAYGAFVYAECDSSCGPGDRIQWYNGRDAVAIPRNNVRRIFGSNMDSFILEPNEMSEFAQRSVNQLNEAGLILSMSPSRQSSGSEGKIQRNSEKTSIKSMSELEQLRNALLYWLSDPVSEEECAGSEVSQVVPYKKISSIELQVAKATGAAIIDFVVNLLKQNFIKLESRLMTK